MVYHLKALPALAQGPVSVSEMSLLHALGPVQTWLGQELEKCGIDAMIYTRYVLSLLLHDSYDYDLQEQVRAPLSVAWKFMSVCTLLFLFKGSSHTLEQDVTGVSSDFSLEPSPRTTGSHPGRHCLVKDWWQSNDPWPLRSCSSVAAAYLDLSVTTSVICLARHSVALRFTSKNGVRLLTHQSVAPDQQAESAKALDSAVSHCVRLGELACYHVLFYFSAELKVRKQPNPDS